MMYKIIFLLFICLAGEAAFADTQDVNLRLEVFQSLREGVKGVDMENEYVRIGIPFTKGMIKEIKGRPSISVKNSEFQSRTLKKWTDGSVKWALIEFLASVKEGGKAEVVVKEGNGISSDKFLASEKDNVIRIDTEKIKPGLAKFV